MPFERETERLRLRRPTAEDLAGFVALHTDPRTYEHAPASMPTPAQCRERLASYLLDWEQFGFGYLAVEEIATGRLVGWGGVRLTMEPRTLNLYYRLAHDALGRGYGREMASGHRGRGPRGAARPHRPGIDQAPQPGLDGHGDGGRPRRGRREA